MSADSTAIRCRQRDAHVGLHQREGVIDAIAHHGHTDAVGLQFPHGLGLTFRAHQLPDLSAPELIGDPPASTLAATDIAAAAKANTSSS